jgi:lipoprotein NlpI
LTADRKISKERLPRNLIFNYNGINIEIAREFNYLGIYFSRTGSFKVCKNHLSEQMYLFQNVIIAGTPDLTAVQ